MERPRRTPSVGSGQEHPSSAAYLVLTLAPRSEPKHEHPPAWISAVSARPGAPIVSREEARRRWIILAFIMLCLVAVMVIRLVVG